MVRTLAGGGVNGYADGAGLHALFSRPLDVAVDRVGNIYVADTGNLPYERLRLRD